MGKRNEYVDYLLELMKPLGHVTARPMFGGRIAARSRGPVHGDATAKMRAKAARMLGAEGVFDVQA